MLALRLPGRVQKLHLVRCLAIPWEGAIQSWAGCWDLQPRTGISAGGLVVVSELRAAAFCRVPRVTPLDCKNPRDIT